jgi:hypothetical protein
MAPVRLLDRFAQALDQQADGLLRHGFRPAHGEGAQEH